MNQSVIARRQGRIGRITLNRPRALNALDVSMIHAVDAALQEWRDDPAIHLVVIEGEGERAFCAGGDVRTLREDVLEGREEIVDAFFVHEYALNRAIARYPKPYVALIDGIWMGGGFGLAVHGSARVVSEHSKFAMPEAKLGLFPDVGASFVLPRLRGHYGLYLGLTGAKLGGADAVWVGLATHFVPRAAMAGLAYALADEGIAALAAHAERPPVGELPALEGRVREIFAADSLAGVVAGLEACGDAWAQASLAEIHAASPAALATTFDLLRAGAGRTLEQCQRAELLQARISTRHPDFVEGVRAMVVDKDRAPRWAAA